MINVSNEFRRQMVENTEYKQYAVMTLMNGNTLTLSDEDFCISGNSMVDGFGDGFPLGVAVAKTIQIEIANYEEQYSSYDFFGAKIRLYLDFYLSESGRTERVEKGVYTVIEPETYGFTIAMSAVDDMYLTNKPYETTLIYPASIKNIMIDIANKCSIYVKSYDFNNSNFVVEKKPENVTFRDMIGYIAMIAGGNARFNYSNSLEFISYDKNAFSDKETTKDGGTFSTQTTPYSDGDNLDGGSFNFTDGDTFDAGTFTNWNVLPTLSDFIELNVDTDDVIITGVRMSFRNDDGEDITVMNGSDGYVIEVENPLCYYAPQNAINLISASVVGLRFRTFEGNYIANPIIEFMDCVYIADARNNYYQTFITDVEFNFFGDTIISNRTEPALRNSSIQYSKPSKEVIEQRRLLEIEKTSREKAIETLSIQMANSSGLYNTNQTQPDGSTIYYMHDKPTLSQSKVVWKLTAQVFGVSTDGGKTYPYMLSADGVAILEKIYAIGLNADYIRTGSLKVQDNSGNVLFDADFDRKQVTIGALNNYMDEATTKAYIDVQNSVIRSEVVELTNVYNTKINYVNGGFSNALDLNAFSDTSGITIDRIEDINCFNLSGLTTGTKLSQTFAINDAGMYSVGLKYYRLGNIGSTSAYFQVENETGGISYIPINMPDVGTWSRTQFEIKFVKNCVISFYVSINSSNPIGSLYLTDISFVGLSSDVQGAINEAKTLALQTSEEVKIEASRAQGVENQLQSSINIQAGWINARVLQHGGNESSFGWDLLSNEFSLSSSNKKVFVCNKDGIVIDGYTKTTDFQAKTAEIESLLATKATITELNSAKADIKSLYANEAQLGSLISDKASISSLNTVDAKVTNLQADHVSVSSFNSLKATVNTINANYITAGAITAELISSKFQSPQAGSMTMGTMRAANLYIYDGTSYRRLYLGSNGHIMYQ